MTTEELIEAMKDEQERRCAYGTREGDGRTCDCKFGIPGSTKYGQGEITGCAELRRAIWMLVR